MSSDNTLGELQEQMKVIRQYLESQQTADTAKDKAFDQLYEELKQYKDDFVFQTEKPLLLDLLLFYDSLQWFKQSLEKKELSPDVIADSYQYLIDEFLELLYRRDVVPVEQSNRFDREIHKAVKVLETDDKSKDYSVHDVLKRGFLRNDRILRPEEVVIERFKKSGD